MVCFLGWWFRFHRESQVGVEGFMQHVCCVIGFPTPFRGCFAGFPNFFLTIFWRQLTFVYNPLLLPFLRMLQSKIGSTYRRTEHRIGARKRD